VHSSKAFVDDLQRHGQSAKEERVVTRWFHFFRSPYVERNARGKFSTINELMVLPVRIELTTSPLPIPSLDFRIFTTNTIPSTGV
jgi:hypothetical protein